jgi:hypothetical protein
VVITTREEESLISDLAETFDNLNRYKLKLNPKKCSFGVSAIKILQDGPLQIQMLKNEICSCHVFPILQF